MTVDVDRVSMVNDGVSILANKWLQAEPAPTDVRVCCRPQGVLRAFPAPRVGWQRLRALASSRDGLRISEPDGDDVSVHSLQTYGSPE